MRLRTDWWGNEPSRRSAWSVSEDTGQRSETCPPSYRASNSTGTGNIRGGLPL